MTQEETKTSDKTAKRDDFGYILFMENIDLDE